MRLCEAKRLAAKHGCTIKQERPGLWRVIRSADNWGYLTKRELNRTNEAKFVSFYVPEARERASA
jgi:hypothetical protein